MIHLCHSVHCSDNFNAQWVCRRCGQRHAGGTELCQHGRTRHDVDCKRTPRTLHTAAHLSLYYWHTASQP